jgi:FkbM family methyltransferase
VLADKFSYYVPYMAKLQYGFLYINKGDVVIDVGASPGDFTLHASTLVGKIGKVIAVEPQPMNFSLLKLNVMINNLKNVVLVNKAISSYEGKALLAGSNTNAHLSDSGVEVETVTLDKLITELGLSHADVVKIDVEGHEEAVLRGFSMLSKVREIAVETHDMSSFRYIAERLIKEGFRIYILDNALLVRNFVNNVLASCLPDFLLAEFKSKFFMSKSLLRYLLKLQEHPAPACRKGRYRVIYGKRKKHQLIY